MPAVDEKRTERIYRTSRQSPHRNAGGVHQPAADRDWGAFLSCPRFQRQRIRSQQSIRGARNILEALATGLQDLGHARSLDYTLSGSATLVGHNEIKIVFSPESINCTTPPPPPCTATSTNSSNFNGTPISAGDYIWFNANFSASGIPSSGVTVTLTKSTISFSAGGTNYNLMVPNAQITFSPSATCTSTSFDTMTNTWITTVPISGDDEIFLTGLAWPVPSGGLAGGVQPVAWEGTFSTDTPGISMNWKWGAAVYSTFTTDYNALAIKPAHNNACGLSNGDHAGTPEGVNNSNQPWKQFVVGGARGGGGSNWTGSWSGTLNVTPLCESSLVCPINRDHLIAQLF